MPYRLKRSETLPDSLQRIFTEQCHRASDALDDAASDRQTAIHDARKRIKKLRSLLRLMRGAIGKQTFKRENDRLRGLAHGLGGVRDADTLIESYDNLLEQDTELTQSAALSPIRDHLVQHRDAIRRTEDLESSMQNQSETLRELPEEMAELSVAKRRFAGIRGGYRRTYQRARKRFRQAYADPSASRFHEWRKRVKDDWYQTRLLRSLWPGPMKARASELKALAKLLGDDHDLYLLQAQLDREGKNQGPGKPLLLCLAKRRQTALREAAYRLGCRLYADKPACRIDSLELWWNAWKANR